MWGDHTEGLVAWTHGFFLSSVGGLEDMGAGFKQGTWTVGFFLSCERGWGMWWGVRAGELGYLGRLLALGWMIWEPGHLGPISCEVQCCRWEGAMGVQEGSMGVCGLSTDIYLFIFPCCACLPLPGKGSRAWHQQ